MNQIKLNKHFFLMKKSILFLAIIATFFACGKDPLVSDACITSCSPSVPGKINIAIEDHTELDIKNFTMDINSTTTAFTLFPKGNKGSYSCWQTFNEVGLITNIQFNIGDNSIHQEIVEYRNLENKREYSIDITSDPTEGIRVQLVTAPDCVSSPD